jgi:hypothetical protein
MGKDFVFKYFSVVECMRVFAASQQVGLPMQDWHDAIDSKFGSQFTTGIYVLVRM